MLRRKPAAIALFLPCLSGCGMLFPFGTQDDRSSALYGIRENPTRCQNDLTTPGTESSIAELRDLSSRPGVWQVIGTQAYASFDIDGIVLGSMRFHQGSEILENPISHETWISLLTPQVDCEDHDALPAVNPEGTGRYPILFDIPFKLGPSPKEVTLYLSFGLAMAKNFQDRTAPWAGYEDPLENPNPEARSKLLNWASLTSKAGSIEVYRIDDTHFDLRATQNYWIYGGTKRFTVIARYEYRDL